MDTSWIVSGQTNDDARIGMGGKVFGGILVHTPMIYRVCRCIADVEPTAVVADVALGVQILNRELPQGLIVLREVSLHLALQAVSLPIVSPQQSLPNGRDGLVRLGRIDVHVAGFARP